MLVGQGQTRIDAIRQVEITEQTYYRWRKQYGGMGTDQLKELKRLQRENERLRRAVSDLTLDKLILTEAAKGNFRAPHVAGPALTWFGITLKIFYSQKIVLMKLNCYTAILLNCFMIGMISSGIIAGSDFSHAKN